MGRRGARRAISFVCLARTRVVVLSTSACGAESCVLRARHAPGNANVLEQRIALPMCRRLAINGRSSQGRFCMAVFSTHVTRRHEGGHASPGHLPIIQIGDKGVGKQSGHRSLTHEGLLSSVNRKEPADKRHKYANCTHSVEI